MKNKQWYAQMDGLRCIAVMLVLVEHYILSIGNILGAREQTGRMGVMLFFVISGFLITEGGFCRACICLNGRR
jgi:peptidoglycan/LPS O-acetylase OafA/YrhL